MRIFDAHFHIDKGLADYNISAERKNYIFNSMEQYQAEAGNVEQNDVCSLILDYKNNWNFVKTELRSGRVQGIKIHSRIQQIRAEEYADLIEAYAEIESLKLPTIVDAFYFGPELEIQPNLPEISNLIRQFPNNEFIIAHSGGIKVMEYFLHLKSLPNVTFELSLSLAYLRHATAFQDFEVLLRFGDRNRIIFGTDFPYVNPQEQLNAFLEIAKKLQMPEGDIEKILFSNAHNLFGQKA